MIRRKNYNKQTSKVKFLLNRTTNDNQEIEKFQTF